MSAPDRQNVNASDCLIWINVMPLRTPSSAAPCGRYPVRHEYLPGLAVRRADILAAEQR